jgi:hypothetical protein
MYQITDEASNRADLVFDISSTDLDTGDAIDFTGASVQFGLKDADGCFRATGSTADGSVVLVDQFTLEIMVPEATMKNLCPATYQMGIVATLSNGSNVQIAVISLSVYDGGTP